MATLFRTLAEFLQRIESTKKRSKIVDLAAELLEILDLEEMEPALSMILGRAFPTWSQKTLEISWATLSSILQRTTVTDSKLFTGALTSTGDVGDAAKILFEKSKPEKQTLLLEKPLTIQNIRHTFETIAATKGQKSREKKERLIETLFRQATAIEAKYLTKIVIGEMRTGLNEGLVEQAIAKAFNLPISIVRKASMILGDPGEVAKTAKEGGEEALRQLEFNAFRPVKLMLAQSSNTTDEAIENHGGKTAFEYKYDGARVQIHKLNDEIRIYSRRLTDVTKSLPEIVVITRRNVKANEAILEGEIVAVNDAGQPIPFQHLMRRFKRVHAIHNEAEKIPLRLYLFDVIFVNGKSHIAHPYEQRRKVLEEIAGKISLAKQIITNDKEAASKFLKEALSEGHEGLMAKQLESSYTPGTRAKKWLKIKPALAPLDLVITAAEYGYGRRHGWLSDYYLGAREPGTGQFLEVGKTFKGLTDKEIADITQELKKLTIEEKHGHVRVIPKIVVEVAYNEIQKSPKYKSKMALRFARITRIRTDKTAEEADTIQRIKEIYEQQFAKKGRYKTAK
jgi:DNA ligase-1